jgi:Xaa-Pro aminopeptidase
MSAARELMNFSKRRKTLAKQIAAEGGGVAIIRSTGEILRNGDSTFQHRFDSSFYYLTGFTEPEAVMALRVQKNGSFQATLFCRPKDPVMEIWNGFRYGPDAAKTQFGFDAAFDLTELDTQMPELLKNTPAVYFPFGAAGMESKVEAWIKGTRDLTHRGIVSISAQRDLNSLVDDMRLFKDAAELDVMRRAAKISAEAHTRLMRAAQPGLAEYELEAELLYAFRKGGAQAPAYTSIVATGANACILHYEAGATRLQDGDMVLVDAGCELDGYASDITRSFPANGKFSAAQKSLYSLVLEAEQEAIAQCKSGRRVRDMHHASLKVLVEGMLHFKLLDANKVGNAQDAIANMSYRQFYMHGIGHWLGLDVHDVGSYTEPGTDAGADCKFPERILKPGMVTTVEPGIYVRPAEGVPEAFWNIGIRIEDDVLITKSAPEVLTVDTPKSIKAIEGLMKH